MSIEEFKYLYRFFIIGFLPGLLFFLGYEYLGSRIFHPGIFDIEGAFLKSFTICFAVAFLLRWDKIKKLKKHGIVQKLKTNINNLLSVALLFLITNILLFAFLQFVFNIIVYKSPQFNDNFILSVVINFFILSIFSAINFFKVRRTIAS